MQAPTKRPIRRRPHRLARNLYRGEVTAAFTVCVAGKRDLFTGVETVGPTLDRLRDACDRHGCRAFLYCFMPDHLHVILQGYSPSSDLWRAMTKFKQLSGHWLAVHAPGARWQGDFFDHVLRDDHEVLRQVEYIAQNPVRRGLVSDWRDYAFIGLDTLDFKETLARTQDPG